MAFSCIAKVTGKLMDLVKHIEGELQALVRAQGKDWKSHDADIKEMVALLGREKPQLTQYVSLAI